MDIKNLLAKIDEMASQKHRPVQEIKDWDKIDMSGDGYESSDDDEGDEDYVDDPYDDEYGVRDFAEPGGGSALRAATDDNPRDLPCPTCSRENALTRKDVQLGYQCDRCANAAERGIDMYETQVKKSLKDYISEMSTQTPIPVVGKEGDKTSTQAGFIHIDDTSPAGKAMGKALADLAKQKKAQIVVPNTSASSTTQQQKPVTTPVQSVGATAGSTLREEGSEDGPIMSFNTQDDDDSMDYHRTADVYSDGEGFVVIFNTQAPGMKSPDPVRTKDAEQAEKIARKYTGNTNMNEAKKPKKPKKPFAIGMAAAKKAAGIKAKHATDLPKRVIKKGHEIGKKIEKKEKVDEKWAGSAKVEPTGQYAEKTIEQLKSMRAKLKASGPHERGSKEDKKLKQINFAIRAKKGWKGGVNEAERPSDDSDFGAGLGAGRSSTTLEAKKMISNDDIMKKSTKRKVKESMNPKLKAAYQEGYAHGLREQSCRVKHYEDMEEAHKYYEGYKCGLDECYGMVPIQGLVVGEGDMPPATVPGMASGAMGAELDEAPLMDDELDEMMYDLDEMNRTEYMKHKAKTTPGDTFDAFGQRFKDTEVLEDDAFMFESLDKQLNALLTEDGEPVSEGLSVNMSQGLGGSGDDSVSVTATADDAGKLLAFIKQVGLGGLSDVKDHASTEEPAVAVVSDYGAPQYKADDRDSMMALMSKMTGGDDYESEEQDHEHTDSCGCEESAEEEMAEDQSEDQLEYEVAEDAAEDAEVEMTDHDEDAEAKEDEALAMQNVKEGGDGMEDDEESMDESSEKKLDEWANEAGKKGTEETFETDIAFMTNVISGGLNKPKSTGQTTIPVVAGQKSRMGADGMNESSSLLADWMKLSGIK